MRSNSSKIESNPTEKGLREFQTDRFLVIKTPFKASYFCWHPQWHTNNNNMGNNFKNSRQKIIFF